MAYDLPPVVVAPTATPRIHRRSIPKRYTISSIVSVYKPQPLERQSFMARKKHPDAQSPDGFAWLRFCYEGSEPYTWRGWGDVIRELRDYCDMGQEEFGAMFNVSKVMLGRYERQQAEPPLSFWEKMARTFGLNLSWAFTGRGCPWVPGFEDTEEMRRFGFLHMLDQEGWALREQVIHGKMTVQQLMAKNPRLADMLKNTGISPDEFKKNVERMERLWQERDD